MLAVVATVTIKEGVDEAFVAVMKTLAEATRANESGNHLYALHKAETPNTYVVLERYDDRAAFDAHMSSDHFQTAVGQLGDLLAAELDIQFLEEVL